MAQRQNTLLLKRSNVIGKIPPISGLTLGELAFNTADTILYGSFTSGTTGATEVREIGWNRIHRTGDTVTGNFNFFGDIKISGSSQPSGNALSVTGDTSIIGNTNQIGNNFLTGDTIQLGNQYIIGNTDQFGTFYLNGNTGCTLTVNGDVCIDGDLNMTGNTNQLGNLTLSGNASVYNLSAITLTFDTTYTGTTTYGVMAWDSNFGVPQVGLLGGNVVQKIGESVYAYVRNGETTTLTKGEVVYIFGASGDKMTVKRASATGDTTSSKTLGVVAETIGANQLGYVITQGTLDGLNLGAYTAGDIVWLSTVSGQFTKVKQYAPTHLVFIGVVQRANAGNGQLYVKPQNGYEMEELHDVIATGATYGDILVYSAFSGNDVWVSTKTLTGNYTISGNTSQIGNFNITGNTTQRGNFNITGNTTQSGSTTQVGNYNVTGNTNQLGYNYIVSATTGCTLAVTGTTCLTGPVNITGPTFMSGDFCMNNMNSTGQTGTNCLDTSLIPTGTTVLHQFQGESGVLAHIGDLASGEPNSKGYIYMENNVTTTTLPTANTAYIKMSGITSTIGEYLNLFTTGTTSNELIYNYPPATGTSFTYLKYNISYTARANQNGKQVTFALLRSPFPYSGFTVVPASMTNYMQGSNQDVTGTLTGIVGAIHLDKFYLAISNSAASNTFGVTVSDVTISLFT